jgi:DNA-nicking Smr family endonuclease
VAESTPHNGDFDEMGPIILPIEDELDLHTFKPGDLPELMDDYLDACLDANIFSLRVIHGKGKGILKKRLHRILKQDSRVVSFKDAPPEAGGWGATLVELANHNPD